MSRRPCTELIGLRGAGGSDCASRLVAAARGGFAIVAARDAQGDGA